MELALTMARASEAAVVTVGAAAISAAEQAERAAGLAEKASATALEAQDRVAAMTLAPASPSRRAGARQRTRRTTASATSAPGPTAWWPGCDSCSGFPCRHQPAAPQAGRNPPTELAGRRQLGAVQRPRRLDPADRAGEEDLGGQEIGQASGALRWSRSPPRSPPRSPADGRSRAGCARPWAASASRPSRTTKTLARDASSTVPSASSSSGSSPGEAAASRSSRSRSAHLCSPRPPATTWLRSEAPAPAPGKTAPASTSSASTRRLRRAAARESTVRRSLPCSISRGAIDHQAARLLGQGAAVERLDARARAARGGHRARPLVRR